ncbi:hypothetical protein AC1031_006205 [Aphanomyces cochlioides]|nr:hypothetical protein AC1031_006205 [Aphanomyces cochlioides]
MALTRRESQAEVTPRSGNHIRFLARLGEIIGCDAKGKIRPAYKGDADVDKPKTKKLTAAKVAEVYDASTDHLDLTHRGTESIEPALFAEPNLLKKPQQQQTLLQ